MKNLLVIILIVVSGSISAQVSVNAGGSMLLGFTGNTRPWGGFHVGLEIPRDDSQSIYARFTHQFKQHLRDSISALESTLFVEPIDATSGLLYEPIGALPSMSYTMIEGGTRYYIGNGFDYGFAAYGGSNLMIAFKNVKSNYQDFDESVYKVADNSRISGKLFSLGAGLNGGVKYSFPKFGTLYADIGFNYFFNLASDIGPAITYREDLYRMVVNPLIFNFNLGYRKDIIWK